MSTELKQLVTDNIDKIMTVPVASVVIGYKPENADMVEWIVHMSICSFLDGLGTEALTGDGDPLYSQEDIHEVARAVILAANIAALHVLTGEPVDTIGPTIGTA